MEYDKIISTYPLIPPISENNFYAKIRVFTPGVGQVNVDLGETWGRTEDEARLKMEQKYTEWVNSQPIS